MKTHDSDVRTIDTRRALAALVAAYSVGMVMMYVIPLVVGSIADAFGVREGTAGIVSSLELGTMAVAAFTLSARFGKRNVRGLVFISISGVFVGNVVSMFSVLAGKWPLFVILRGMIGLCEGCLFAASAGMAARTSNPERTFSFLAGWEVLVSVLTIASVAGLVEMMGPSGVYAGLGCVSLLIAPLLVWFPKDGGETVREERQDSRIGLMVVLLLIGLTVFAVGLNTVWPYTERIGVSHGFPLARISLVLLAAASFSILGPVLCGILGTRFGRVLPISIGILVQIAAMLILVHTKSFTWYAGAMIVEGMALMYYLPLLNGLMAFYDPTGGVNVIAAGTTTMAVAVGPLLGGSVLNAGGDYRTLGWIAVATYVVMLVMVFRPAHRADQEGNIRPAPVMS